MVIREWGWRNSVLVDARSGEVIDNQRAHAEHNAVVHELWRLECRLADRPSKYLKLEMALRRLLASHGLGNAPEQHKLGCGCVIHEALAALGDGIPVPMLDPLTTTNVDVLRGEIARLDRAIMVATADRDSLKANCERVQKHLSAMAVELRGAKDQLGLA